MIDSRTALDGNAIGGALLDVFGADLTAATAICVECGDAGPLAAAVVYVRTPGIVVRCRACQSVLMVLTTVRGVTCVDLTGLARLG